MKEANHYKIRFFEFLNDDLGKEHFKNWIYETKELEKKLPYGHYVDLISYNFKSGDLKTYISKLVELFFDWQDFEKWRTIELLNGIINEEIETVLASRKLRKLYLEQEEKIKWPLISIELGLGFESRLDNCPIESEYESWNKAELKKQFEIIYFYKEKIKESAKRELAEITNANVKSIDMGKINSKKHLHELLKEKLRFPDSYGENWDAIYDAMTGLVEMPNSLILYNWGNFETNLPDDAKILKAIVLEYNKESNDHKIEMIP